MASKSWIVAVTVKFDALRVCPMPRFWKPGRVFREHRTRYGRPTRG